MIPLIRRDKFKGDGEKKNMESAINIVASGTGGQGIILIAQILGIAGIKAGYRVRAGEIHGVSQRGGGVLSFIRLGEKIYSSTFSSGMGDFMIGLEPVETLRTLRYVSPSGVIFLNTRFVLPNLVKTGEYTYPGLDQIIGIIKKAVAEVIYLDATQEAIKIGSPLTMNVVMLGILAGHRHFPIPIPIVKEALLESIPQKAVDMNINAFESGVAFSKAMHSPLISGNM